MEIREFQKWLAAWDYERGWNRVEPAHTLVHVMEELGEVARRVLMLEGYKGSKDQDEVLGELSEEMGDLIMMLFKLAYQYGIDLESALEQTMVKVEARYPLDKSRAEMDRYEAVQSGKNQGAGG